MNKLTGIKDLDREILSKIPDSELLTICTINKRFWNDVCDDNFLSRRLRKYPNIEKYKRKNESWKQFFLRVIYYISRMKEEFHFSYTEGDFKKQYDLLQQYKNTDKLLRKAIKNRVLSLVIYSIKEGANIYRDDYKAPLIIASQIGNLDAVKYLVEQGVNIHVNDDDAVAIASLGGHLDVVKYLVEHGADIHIEDEYALRWASRNGHLDVVKYLVEQGADIHALGDEALSWAKRCGSREVVEYLQKL